MTRSYVVTRVYVLMTVLLLGLGSIPRAQAMHFHRKPTSGHTAGHSRSSRKARKTARLHGQQNIDTARAQQIQTALAREHYLTGEPSGVWDDRSKDAMTRYQADHGYQTKITPDSRALIKLGLGPEQPQETGAAVASASHAGTSATVSSSGQTHTLGSAIAAHNSTQNWASAP